jgi:hypothetical protein
MRYALEYLGGYNGSFRPDPAHAAEIESWRDAHPELVAETPVATPTVAEEPTMRRPRPTPKRPADRPRS